MPSITLNLIVENAPNPARKHFEKTNSTSIIVLYVVIISLLLLLLLLSTYRDNICSGCSRSLLMPVPEAKVLVKVCEASILNICMIKDEH